VIYTVTQIDEFKSLYADMSEGNIIHQPLRAT